MVEERLLEVGDHFRLNLPQIKLNNFAECWNMDYIWSSKANSIVGFREQLFTSLNEYEYINCEIRLLPAEYLKQEDKLVRDAELVNLSIGGYINILLYIHILCNS